MAEITYEMPARYRRHLAKLNHRYRTDPAYRDKRKAKALARYYKNKPFKRPLLEVLWK